MTGPARDGYRSRPAEALRGALWPVPAAAVVLAVALGVGLPALDRALQAGGGEPLALLFSGGPSAARTMLSAIASSLISVTTLLFSLTIVTLQLASSQYSPRLLQTFVRDRFVQGCLGILLGTFVYALTVLRSVRSADEAEAVPALSGAFVPRLSVTVAFGLALVSVGALVAFLSHQTRQLRVETMLRTVHAEAGATLRSLARRAEQDRQPDVPLPPFPEGATPLLARDSGFLLDVAEAPLLAATARAGVVLRVLPRPGDPVIEGTPVAWAWPDPGGRVHADGVRADAQADLEAALQRHLALGHERSDRADPSYGLRKLVDIAARGLSPGINDPTTAVHALSHVSDLLGMVTVRTHWHRRLQDDDGQERLLVPSWDFPSLLELGTTQPRHYGREDVDLVRSLFALLAGLGWRVRSPEQRAALLGQRDLLLAQFTAEPPRGWTGQDVARAATDVDRALQRRPPEDG